DPPYPSYVLLSLNQLHLPSTTRFPYTTLFRSSLDIVPPAENRATSIPLSSSSVAAAVSSTTTSSPRNGSVVPAERADAKNRTLSAGKSRSSSRARITRPTWPVAPTTATVVIGEVNS